jgi:hypothetical protein
MELIDYDFIEIGTSNFDALIQGADDTTIGLSIEPIKYYIDCLPDKKRVKKLNLAISDISGEIDVYYIPEDVIVANNLQDWFRGCNSVNKYHPLHIQHDVTHLCKIDRVPVITPAELFTQNKVRGVKYMKIDTEGHDCIILKSLYMYLHPLTKDFYPKRILFETNEHTTVDSVDEIIHMYSKLGYVVESRAYDTVLRFYK